MDALFYCAIAVLILVPLVAMVSLLSTDANGPICQGAEDEEEF